jgi:hypothetical protein
MITREDVADLRPEEKDAILDVILAMAWTDGVIVPTEIALLKKISLYFSREAPETLLADYKTDAERLGRKIARSDLGPAGRKALVKCMAYMAAASGNLNDNDRAFHRQTLRAFGMNDHQQAKVERQVRSYMYGEWVEEALDAGAGEITAEARRGLDEKRKAIELDEASAAQIESDVRHELHMMKD